MQAEVLNLIRSVHKNPSKIVLATAGAGTYALSNLLAVAGASNTLIEARVPYGKNAFIDFVGSEPDKFVSPIAARLLAGSAFHRAQKLTDQFPHSENLIGLACSASIATNRSKQGDHHAWIVTWQTNRIVEVHITLEKEKRTRLKEEKLISKIMLNLLAEACGLPNRISLEIGENDVLKRQVRDHGQDIEDFLAGKSNFVGIYPHGQTLTSDVNPKVLMPGSFNPLHHGHTELAAAAQQILGHPVAFEISALNVDKPPLAKEVVLARIAQFAGHHSIYVTGEPTFLGKARLFPGTVFVIGFDTAERVLMPKYYGGSEAGMFIALTEIQALGCRFLVAGRKGKDGVYDPPEALKAPPGYADMFEAIPDGLFRRDISSSELRQKR
ncbi:MAG: hypothetical protein ACI9EW_003488 [Cellvibrionaceae bacterium]